VGDALGAPVEFMSLAEIREKLGPAGIRDYIPAYGRNGAITDDTQMTLFTAEGLLRADGRGACPPVVAVHHAYLRWLATQGVTVKGEVTTRSGWPDGWLVKERGLWSRRAPGNTCLAALERAESLGELAKNDSKGCGTVMRVAPVGLLYSASGPVGPCPAFDVGVEISRLTHGHPSGYYAGGFFAELIAHLSDGRSLRDAIDRAMRPLREHEDAEEVIAAVEGAVRLSEDGNPTPERVESLGGGWTAEEATAIALYVALTVSELEDALRVAVNHSGDSDSTGSLVGNILGVMQGVDAIPPRWLDRLELRDVIEAVGTDLLRLRNGTFDRDEEKYPRG
jgi:ADP-ribosylglycohydrolase